MPDLNVQVLIEARDQASSALRKIDAEIKRVGDTTQRSAAQSTAAAVATDKLSASWLNLGNVMKVAAVGVGFTALGGGAAMVGQLTQSITGLVTAGVSLNASLETSTQQFTTFMGSAAKAEAHVKSLFDFAARTPFESKEVVAASRQLQTMGGAALNTKATLELVGNAAAATSSGFEEVAFWTGRAYSAIQSGRPFGEAAARLQELGILSGDARNALEDMQKSGGRAADMWRVFTGNLNQFGGAMARQATTFDGMVSTLKDNIAILAATGTEPLFEALKDSIEALNTTLSDPATIEGMKNTAAAIRDIGAAALWTADKLQNTPGSPFGAIGAVGEAAAIIQGIQAIQTARDEATQKEINNIRLLRAARGEPTSSGDFRDNPAFQAAVGDDSSVQAREDARLEARQLANRANAALDDADVRLAAALREQEEEARRSAQAIGALAQTHEQAARSVDKETLAHARWEKEAEKTQTRIDGIKTALAGVQGPDRERLIDALRAEGITDVDAALAEMNTPEQRQRDTVRMTQDALKESDRITRENAAEQKRRDEEDHRDAERAAKDAERQRMDDAKDFIQERERLQLQAIETVKDRENAMHDARMQAMEKEKDAALKVLDVRLKEIDALERKEDRAAFDTEAARDAAKNQGELADLLRDRRQAQLRGGEGLGAINKKIAEQQEQMVEQREKVEKEARDRLREDEKLAIGDQKDTIAERVQTEREAQEELHGDRMAFLKMEADFVRQMRHDAERFLEGRTTTPGGRAATNVQVTLSGPITVGSRDDLGELQRAIEASLSQAIPSALGRTAA